MAIKFNCYDCGKVIEPECDEEDVRKESIKNFGYDLLDSDEPHALVCDDCYEKNLFNNPVMGSLN